MGRPALYVLLLALFLAPAAMARAGDIFQDAPSGVEFSSFPSWRQVLQDAQADDACAGGRRCRPPAWTAFLETLRSRPPLERIAAVNRWVNQQPYVEDLRNWGVADYWATPGEFLGRGGDCEDYAIAKYFSLVRLGVPADDLRLVIVKDVKLGVFHAVLAVNDQGQTWLLDNQVPDVVPISAAPQYEIIYALNEQGWWMPSPPRIELGAVIIVAAGPSGRR